MFFPHCVVLYWFLEFPDIPFLDFLVSIFFSCLVKKNVDLLLDNWVQKISFLFERNPCFLEFYHFLLLICFCMHDFQKKQFAIILFSMSLNKSCFFCLNIFLLLFKKNSPQKDLDSLYFMFSLLDVTLLILRAFLLFSFLFSLTMFPLLVFALVMFIYSLAHVYLLSLFLSLSLSLLCFFCLILFLMTFIFSFFFCGKKSSFFHLFIAFCETVLFYLHCCFAFFLVVLFNRVRSNKIH